MRRRNAKIKSAARRTPVQARSTAMVEGILQAATELLSQQPEVINTNQIAQRAGASIGSLYQYFANKEEIMDAVLERTETSLLNALERASRIEDWQSALNTMICVVVKHQLDQPLLAHHLDEHESLKILYDQPRPAQQRIQTLLGSVLQRIPHLCDNIEICNDLICITRALCDAAGKRRDYSVKSLTTKIERAVFSYIAYPLATLQANASS